MTAIKATLRAALWHLTGLIGEPATRRFVDECLKPGARS